MFCTVGSFQTMKKYFKNNKLRTQRSVNRLYYVNQNNQQKDKPEMRNKLNRERDTEAQRSVGLRKRRKCNIGEEANLST